MFKNLKHDLPASIVVFLVALPLWLGVALASGAPLLAGIISGIVGGLVVGYLSGSQTSVSGPAAGMAAVVFAAIAELGSFEVFLTAVVLAGLIQLLMGVAKAGFIANYIPSNVIKGLLAAIGIILILKQIPHATGYDIDAEEDFAFFQGDNENTFTELFKALNYITPGAVVISGVSLLILLFWDRTPLRKLKFFPASLFVVLLGLLLSLVFKSYVPFLSLEPAHLVNIPPLDIHNLGSYLHLPTLAHLSNGHVWKVAFTIAVVASLETLLNIEAIDKTDPQKRNSPPNRELLAQGVGNVVAGLLGGIPVTSVIVRSSVNVQSGNKTKASAILHGGLMLVSVLVLAPVLNLIPLASLAAILLMTGYKLAKISLFKEMYRKGWQQFIPFVLTIVTIVFTDLLIGVVVGLVVSVFFLLRSNYRNPFLKEASRVHAGEVLRLELPSQVSFFNKATIKETLWAVPAGGRLLIDASAARFIDDDVLEVINDFKTVVAPEKNIKLNVLGLKDSYQTNDQVEFVNTLDKATRERLQPAEVLALLRAGNQRFAEDRGSKQYFRQQMRVTAEGQSPMAIVIGCIDSRTSPEILFDAGLGELATIRVAGNIISPEILGSLEIAVDKLGVKLIVVKGHSRCGAVATTLKPHAADENLTAITSKIRRAVVACGCADQDYTTVDAATVERITQQNIENSIADILALSPYLRERIASKEVGLVGAYLDISNGQVEFGELV